MIPFALRARNHRRNRWRAGIHGSIRRQSPPTRDAVPLRRRMSHAARRAGLPSRTRMRRRSSIPAGRWSSWARWPSRAAAMSSDAGADASSSSAQGRSDPARVAAHRSAHRRSVARSPPELPHRVDLDLSGGVAVGRRIGHHDRIVAPEVRGSPRPSTDSTDFPSPGHGPGMAYRIRPSAPCRVRNNPARARTPRGRPRPLGRLSRSFPSQSACLFCHGVMLQRLPATLRGHGIRQYGNP